MAIYEFECINENCKETREIICSMKHLDHIKDTTFCAKCNALMIKKVSSGTDFNLKGDGWAATGYQKS